MAKKTVIETLVVELTTDNSKFNRGMRDLSKTLTRTGRSLQNFGRKFTRGMLSAFALVSVAALKLGKDYDMAMNRVRAVTQATIEDMGRLSEKARLLGRTTARSARQIAEGMETLGLAGFSTQQIEDSIAAVTSLSVISQQEMGASAQNAANIMAQFGIEAINLSSAVDMLAVTATSSNQTVEDLINGLKFAGPIAKQAGLELHETAAAMGILANNGIRAGIGGRALRMGILKMIAPTSQASEEMKKLGISATDAITGEILPFNDILSNVNKGLMGLSDANRLATLRVLFGTRALGPMNILLKEQAKVTEDGSNAFMDFADAILDSSGRAAEMEGILLTGLPGALILFKSALEGALLSFREVFDENVIGIITGVTSLLNAFSDLDAGNSVILDYIFNINKLKEDFGIAVDFITGKIDVWIEKLFGVQDATATVVDGMRAKWESLITFLEDQFGFNLTGEMTRGAIIDIGLLITAVGPLLFVIGGVISGVGGLIGMFSTLATTALPVIFGIAEAVGGLLAGLNPVVIAVVAIVAAVVGLSVLLAQSGEDMDGMRARMADSFSGVSEVFSDVWEKIKEFIDSIKEAFDRFTAEISSGELGASLAEFGTAFIETMGGILEVIGIIAGEMFVILKVLFDWFMEFLFDPLVALFTGIVDGLTGMLGVISGLVTAIKGILTGDTDLILAGMEKIVAGIEGLLVGIREGVFGFFTSLWETTGAEEAWTSTMDSLKTVLETFKVWWDNFWRRQFAGFKEQWSGGMSFITDGWTTITEALTSAWNTFIDTVVALPADMWDGFIGLLDGLVQLFGAFGETTVGGLTSFNDWLDAIDQDFRDWISGLASSISDGFKAGFTSFLGTGKMETQLVEVTKRTPIFDAEGNRSFKTETVLEEREVIVEEVGTLIKSINGLKDTLTGVWDGFINGITGGITGILTKFDELKEGIISIFSETGPLAFIGTFFDSMISGLVGGFLDGITDVLNDLVTGINVLIGAFNKVNPFTNIPKLNAIKVPQLAEGGYVSARKGGILANIGEGKHDEIVAPLPMMQKLVRDAIKASQSQLLTMLKSSSLLGEANKSVGTSLTPMKANQAQQNSQTYNYETKNEFRIDGNIGEQVRAALTKEDRDRKLRIGGFRV